MNSPVLAGHMFALSLFYVPLTGQRQPCNNFDLRTSITDDNNLGCSLYSSWPSLSQHIWWLQRWQRWYTLTLEQLVHIELWKRPAGLPLDQGTSPYNLMAHIPFPGLQCVGEWESVCILMATITCEGRSRAEVIGGRWRMLLRPEVSLQTHMQRWTKCFLLQGTTANVSISDS